jgi:hypothetical protein
MPNSVRGSKKGAKKGSKAKAGAKADKNSDRTSPKSVTDPVVEEAELAPVEFEPPALDSFDLLARDVAAMMPEAAVAPAAKQGGSSIGEKPSWLLAISPQLEVRHSCFAAVIARPTTTSAAGKGPAAAAAAAAVAAVVAAASSPSRHKVRFGYSHCDICSFYFYQHCADCPRCGA